VGQVALLGIVDAALERRSEDGDRDLGHEARPRLSETAPAQRLGERRRP
jgi:hypothetical protein